jgi:hypothetical protein
MREIRTRRDRCWISASLRYITERIHEEDLSALWEMGLDQATIDEFRELRMMDWNRIISRFPQRNVGLSAKEGEILIGVDLTALIRLVRHVNAERQNERVFDELIQANAPYELVSSYFGISTRQFAQRRKLFGLQGTGRIRAPEDGVIEAVWNECSKVLRGRSPCALSPRDLLLLHRKTGEDLRVVWRVLHTEIIASVGGCVEEPSMRPYFVARAVYS